MDPIRLSYVKGFTKLSLWYVWRRARRGEEPFADVVNKRVNIYRNTAFYDGKRHPSGEDVGPEWRGMVDRLASLFVSRKSDSSAVGFESAGLALLWPCLEARLRVAGDGVSGERPYECWSYDYTSSGRLNIHIDNVYRPEFSVERDVLAFRGVAGPDACGFAGAAPRRHNGSLQQLDEFHAAFPVSVSDSLGGERSRESPYRLYNGALGAVHGPMRRLSCRKRETISRHRYVAFPLLGLRV